MRRSSPALFELMRRGDAGSGPGRAPTTPTTPVTPPPAPPVEVSAPARPAPPSPPAPPAPPVPAAESAFEADSDSRPAGRAWVSESASESGVQGIVLALQRRLSVSVSTALIAAGGVLALVVIVWSAGYQAGESRAEQAARRDLGLEAPPVVREPLAGNVPVNPNLLANTDKANAAQPKPAAPPLVEPIRNPTVPVPGDPREAGRNYLQLITTDRDEADRLIAFLAENGVGAFAVGVDRGGKPTNNPARFMVFCSRGITGEEFRERAPARTEVDRAIATLGPRWKAEHKGSGDLRGAMWSKYSP